MEEKFHCLEGSIKAHVFFWLILGTSLSIRAGGGDRLKELGTMIRMDDKVRWIDNVVIERFWRSIKFEDIYLKPYKNAGELDRGVEAYIICYNLERLRQRAEGGNAGKSI